ncbi:unnamed protein product, partial [Laminaria digitata]
MCQGLVTVRPQQDPTNSYFELLWQLWGMVQGLLAWFLYFARSVLHITRTPLRGLDCLVLRWITASLHLVFKALLAMCMRLKGSASGILLVLVCVVVALVLGVRRVVDPLARSSPRVVDLSARTEANELRDVEGAAPNPIEGAAPKAPNGAVSKTNKKDDETDAGGDPTARSSRRILDLSARTEANELRDVEDAAPNPTEGAASKVSKEDLSKTNMKDEENDAGGQSGEKKPCRRKKFHRAGRKHKNRKTKDDPGGGGE